MLTKLSQDCTWNKILVLVALPGGAWKGAKEKQFSKKHIVKYSSTNNVWRLTRIITFQRKEGCADPAVLAGSGHQGKRCWGNHARTCR